MMRRFLSLEWKSFSRSAAFQTNLALKILMAVGALYFMVCFLILALAVYPLLAEEGYNLVQTINTPDTASSGTTSFGLQRILRFPSEIE